MRAKSTELSENEFRVLCGLAERLSLGEIAQRIYASHATVAKARTSAYGKLGVHTIYDAVVTAWWRGVFRRCPVCRREREGVEEAPPKETLLPKVKPRAPFKVTKRRLEILQLLARGLSNEKIGAELCLTELTIKSHLSYLGKAMGTGDRTHMVALGFKYGLLTGDDVPDGDRGGKNHAAH